MKMKKLFLTIVVAILLVVAATSCANAATVSVNTKYEVGDTVTLTINFEETRNIDLVLDYNSEVLDYNTDSCTTDGFRPRVNPETGVIYVSGVDIEGGKPIHQITFTFTAKKDGTADFKVSNFVTEKGEALGAVPVVEVVAKADPVKPDTNTSTTDPVKPSTNTTTDTKNPAGGNTQSSTKKPSAKPSSAPAGAQASVAPASSGVTNGMPTKLPQTGVNYAIIAIIALAIVTAVVVRIKVKSNNK